MGLKNRKDTRFIANFAGFYRLRNTYEWLECDVYDISISGILIKIKQPLFKDDQIEIRLDEEDVTNIVDGTVANTNGQIAGIELATQNDSDIIEKSIRRAFTGTQQGKKKSGF